jgi:sulfur-oxidizing protein SoxY
MANITRRAALQMAVGTAVIATSAAPVFGATPDAAAALDAFTGGKPALPGGIVLDLAEMVEDGNSVPLSIAVDPSMTSQATVTEILVVAEANPWPRVATFQFTPLSGNARVSTRIRLTGNGAVVVVAKLSDGRMLTARQHVEVTVGACSN